MKHDSTEILVTATEDSTEVVSPEVSRGTTLTMSTLTEDHTEEIIPTFNDSHKDEEYTLNQGSHYLEFHALDSNIYTDSHERAKMLSTVSKNGVNKQCSYCCSC